MQTLALITSDFYPYPNVSAVRATNWAKMLPGHDYRPVVVSRASGYQADAEDLAKQVHPAVESLQLLANGQVAPQQAAKPTQIATRPHGLNALKLEIQRQVGGFWLPDGSIRFWRRVYPSLLKEVRQRDCQVVLTTSPRSATAEVGRWLKRDLGIPWIADFRDPPLLDKRSRPHGISQLTLPRHRAWLDSVYREADVILHAIPTHARWARLVYPEARRRCVILRHPVPEDLAAGTVTPITSTIPGRKSIAVVGVLQPQILELLAKAIALLVAKDPKKHDLELKLVGTPPAELKALSELLGDRLTIVGRVANPVAKQHMVGADVLVNAVSLERQQYLLVSSKLFEYAAARRPIITINPTRTDRELLKHLSAVCLSAPTCEQMATSIAQSLEIDRKKTTSENDSFIAANCWLRHHEKLVKVIDLVTNGDSEHFDFRCV